MILYRLNWTSKGIKYGRWFGSIRLQREHVDVVKSGDSSAEDFTAFSVILPKRKRDVAAWLNKNTFYQDEHNIIDDRY